MSLLPQKVQAAHTMIIFGKFIPEVFSNATFATSLLKFGCSRNISSRNTRRKRRCGNEIPTGLRTILWIVLLVAAWTYYKVQNNELRVYARQTNAAYNGSVLAGARRLRRSRCCPGQQKKRGRERERAPTSRQACRQTLAVTHRADVHGKRTQPTVAKLPGVPAVQSPMITPSSLMLLGRVVPNWQNGGSNEVIVPSGDRTKPKNRALPLV